MDSSQCRDADDALMAVLNAALPSYVKGPVNWAQGFSYGTWVGTTWNMTTVVANKSGQFVAEGKLY